MFLSCSNSGDGGEACSDMFTVGLRCRNGAKLWLGCGVEGGERVKYLVLRLFLRELANTLLEILTK